MIYYKIREKKKTDKVESEEFVTAEVRAHIGYYAMVACEYPPESAKNLVNVDSYSDLELNNSILDWLDEVVVSQPGGYHQVTFSDGTIRYHALSPMEQNTVRSDDYTPKELLNIYEGANGWSKTIPGTNSWNPNIPFVPVNPTIPVMPPVSIPAPLPIPVLV